MAQDPICGMQVDEKTAIKLTVVGKDYFFCSEHCMRKFAMEHNIEENMVSTCSVFPQKGFLSNKTIIVIFVLSGIILLSYFIPFLAPLRKTFFVYFNKIWWAILLGIFLGGIIDYYVPRKYISHILASGRRRTIFYSVILGFFMSACSHGILALSMELHKKGASNPAVVSFLLASPWANMTITIMLIGFFGLKAFYIIICAIIIAITTGLIFQTLERKNLIEKNKNSEKIDPDFSIKEDFKKRWKNFNWSLESLKSDAKGIYRGMVALSDMVLWWVLIGMGLASIAGAYIPTAIFHHYMGPTVAGLFVTLLLATIIEVCSEGSSPMAFEIFRQTQAFGNAFVFLMAGVVTDYTEIGLIWHNVGRKTAIWLPIVTVPQVILFGIIANAIF